MEEILNALFFGSSYNALVVSCATALEGAAAGLLGVHLLHRRKSLMVDALSHATLPGVALGFIGAYVLMEEGRREWFLLGGALCAMLVALSFIHYISRWTKQDTALALTLSGFYGLGIALLSYIQSLPTGAAAGLETFILGQSATINLVETQFIAGGAFIVLGLGFLLHKEWTLLCFDQSYARSQAYPTRLLDFSLMVCTIIVIALGLKAMGLILIIAMLTIPALTAHLLLKTWRGCLLGAIVIGSVASHIGVSISVGVTGIPSGVSIVLVCALFYICALLCNKNAVARLFSH